MAGLEKKLGAERARMAAVSTGIFCELLPLWLYLLKRITWHFYSHWVLQPVYTKRSIGSSGRVGRGEKHEIYAAAFGDHLFYDLFLHGLGVAWSPRPSTPPLPDLFLERQWQSCDVAYGVTSDIALIKLLRILNKLSESPQKRVVTPINQIWRKH